jgi:heptosyltransferase I
MSPNNLQKILDRNLGIPLCILLGGCQSVGTGTRRSSPKRILFIQLSAIGDTILAVPTIRAIRHRFPEAHLAIVASSINLQYLEHCPYIDQHIPCRLEELIRHPRSLLKFFTALQRQRFDWVIDLEHWPRLSAVIAYGSGASRRIGFRAAGQYRHYPFTDVIPHLPGRHEVINFLEIAKLLGCQIGETHLEAWPGAADWEWAANFIRTSGVDENRAIVVFHPEAGRRGEPRRRWPHHRFVQVADSLAERYQVQVILTGAPSEVELSQQIALETQCHCIVAAGQTKLNQLAALFGTAALVITGNCGPMHLAAAMGTPVIALHGPTNASQWGPWMPNHTAIGVDLPCSPCLNLGFEYGCRVLPDGLSPCMYTIQVGQVLEACKKYLSTDENPP